MRKLIRRLVVGAGIAWLVKAYQDKKLEWSARPTADVRREVVSKLPAGLDPATKEKVADKIVKTVKGNDPIHPDEVPPAAQHLTSPPPPQPPPDIRE